MPNPYVILGAIGFLFLACAGSFWYGGHVTALKYDVAINAQKADAANVLAAANAAITQKERDYAALKDENEKLHVDHAIAITKAYADNRDLLAQLYDAQRVQQPGRGASSPNKLPATTGRARMVAGSAVTLQLSEQDGSTLIRLARDADTANDNFIACRSYARQLTAAADAK